MGSFLENDYILSVVFAGIEKRYYCSGRDNLYKIDGTQPELSPVPELFKTIFTANNGDLVKLTAIYKIDNVKVDEFIGSNSIVKLDAQSIELLYREFVEIAEISLIDFIWNENEHIFKSENNLPVITVNELLDDVVFKGPNSDITFNNFKLEYDVKAFMDLEVNEESILLHCEVNSLYIRDFNFIFDLNELPASLSGITDFIRIRTQEWLQNNFLVNSSTGVDLFVDVISENYGTVEDPALILKEAFSQSAFEITDNLLTRFSYEETRIVEKLIELNFSVSEISTVLDSKFGRDSSQVFSILLSNNIEDLTILHTLQELFEIESIGLADILVQAGYDYKRVAPILFDEFELSAEEIGLYLQSKDIDSTILLDILINVLIISAEDVLEISKKLDYSMEAVTGILYKDLDCPLNYIYGLHSIDGLSINDSIKIFHDGLGLNLNDIVMFMKEKVFSSIEIINAFKSAFDVSYNDTAQILKSTGTSAKEISTAFSENYGYAETDLINLLDEISVTVNDMASVLQYLYSYNDRQITSLLLNKGKLISLICSALYNYLDFPLLNVLAILKENSISNEDTALILYSNMKVPASSVINILQEKGLLVTDIGEILRETLQLSLEEMGTSLDEAGFTTTEIARLLGVYLEYPESEVFEVLKNIGVPATEIAELMKHIFSYSGEEMAAEIYNSGTSALKIAEILLNTYFFPVIRTASLLDSLSITTSEITGILKTVYAIEYNECYEILNGLNHSVENIALAIWDNYDLPFDQLMHLLKENMIQLGVISRIVAKTLKFTEIDFVRSLNSIDATVNLIVNGLLKYYDNDAKSIVLNLFRGGISVEKIIDIFHFHHYFQKIFHLHLSYKHHRRKHFHHKYMMHFKHCEFVDALFSNNAPLNKIITAYKNIMDYSETHSFRLLACSSVGNIAIASALKEIYDTPPLKIGMLFHSKGLDVTEIMEVLHSAYGLPAEELVAIISKIFIKERDDIILKVSTMIKYLYNCTPESFVLILVKNNIKTEIIAKNLKTIYMSTADELTGCFLTAAIDLNTIVAILQKIYTLPGDLIAKVLFNHAISLDEIARSLKEIGKLKVDEILICLSLLDTDFKNVINALITASSLDKNAMTQILFGSIDSTPEIIARVLREFYECSAIEAAITMKLVKMSSDLIKEGLKEGYELTEEEAVNILTEVGLSS